MLLTRLYVFKANPYVCKPLRSPRSMAPVTASHEVYISILLHTSNFIASKVNKQLMHDIKVIYFHCKLKTNEAINETKLKKSCQKTRLNYAAITTDLVSSCESMVTSIFVSFRSVIVSEPAEK